MIGGRVASRGTTEIDQAMDWPTVQARRVGKEALGTGVWSILPSLVAVAEYHEWLLTSFMRGKGKGGWFGWRSDPRLDETFDVWLAAVDPAEQTKPAREYALLRPRSLPFILLG